MLGAIAGMLMAGALIVAAVVTANADSAKREGTEAASQAPQGQPEEIAPDPPPAAPEDDAVAEPEARPEAQPEAATEPAEEPEPAAKPEPEPAVQKLAVGLGQYGYDPSTLSAEAGRPIELTVAEGQGCAAGFLIPSLDISADNTKGPVTVSLPALDPGTYRFYCGMQMVEGKLVVR